MDQNKLLEVLFSLGFRGPINEFLTSYLLSRSQRVRIKDKVCKPKPCHFGVPQGSVMGPLLFKLYVNEITRASGQLDLILFAYDTVLIQNYSTDQIDFQNGVNDIVVWLNNTNLSINCDMTFEVLFNKNKNLDCSLFSRTLMNNKTIERKREVKYLGIVVDRELKFAEHVQYLINKMNIFISLLTDCGRY